MSVEASVFVPAVSVLMPVYNAERFLEPAIRSVLDQTFTDFELLIVNDGSRDSSGEIIARLAEADTRVVVVDQQNAGIVASLNRATTIARSPLLARMDADDIALPQRLFLQHREFSNRPDLAALGGHARLIDSTGRITGTSFGPVGYSQITKVVLEYSPLTHATVMLRKSSLEAVGGYRAHYETAEDYDLWLRLLDANYVIDNLNEMLLHYRQHDHSISASRRKQQALCALLARSASLMRRQGVTDKFIEQMAVDEATLRRMPKPFRPSESQVIEALHGYPSALDNETLQHILLSLNGAVQTAQGNREIAAFRLRCGLVLVGRGRYDHGLHAVRDAVRADGLVIFRHLLQSVGRRLVRFRRRLRFMARASLIRGAGQKAQPV